MISVWSLIHACVATVAALAGEMTAEYWHMCYLAIAGEDFIKFGLHVAVHSDISSCVPWPSKQISSVVLTQTATKVMNHRTAWCCHYYLALNLAAEEGNVERLKHLVRRGISILWLPSPFLIDWFVTFLLDCMFGKMIPPHLKSSIPAGFCKLNRRWSLVQKKALCSVLCR